MPGTSYTRSEVRSQILREMQDESAVYFSTDLVNDRIDDACDQWCGDTRLRIINGAIDIVANQSLYSLTGLSPRVIEVLRESCPSGASATDDVPLRVLSQTDLDQDYPNWRSQPASWPFAVIRDLAGPQSLMLYPAPASNQEATIRTGTYFSSQATGGMVSIEGMTASQASAATGGAVSIQYLLGSLQVYYIAGADSISSDSTTLETACGISPDLQDAIFYFVCARLCESDVVIAQRDKAQMYWQKYGALVQEALNRGRAGMQFRPPRVVRGRPF